VAERLASSPWAAGGYELPPWVGGDAPGEVPQWVHDLGDPPADEEQRTIASLVRPAHGSLTEPEDVRMLGEQPGRPFGPRGVAPRRML
jgi:hypothetical protein